MDARTVLIDAMKTRGLPNPEWEAEAIINRLSLAGFTIIHDSENHGPTLERFRQEVFRLMPHYQSNTATDAGRRQMLEHLDEWANRVMGGKK